MLRDLSSFHKLERVLSKNELKILQVEHSSDLSNVVTINLLSFR